MNSQNIILGMETGVLGGSLSLIEEGNEIDSWSGQKNISKSEDVLDELSQMLNRNKLSLQNIKKIVISSGPGSFTGLRIGKAIALGLRASTRCMLLEMSCLDALLFLLENPEKYQKIIAAVQFSRTHVGWKEINVREDRKKSVAKEIKLGDVEEFCLSLEEGNKTVILNKTFIRESNLIERLTESKRIELITPEENIAFALAVTVYKNEDLFTEL